MHVTDLHHSKALVGPYMMQLRKINQCSYT